MTVALVDSRSQTRLANSVWWLGYLVVMAGGLTLTALARRRFETPFLSLSLALLLVLLLGWLLRPRVTLYCVIFLTAVSDIVTVWWFPFTKNLSSRESISFLADSATISPLEISLYSGVAVSMLRHYAHTHRPVARNPLNWVMLIFTGLVLLGFVRGQVANGDLRIAVLEGRSMLYVALAFVIVVNECRTATDLRRALYALLAGVIVQSLLSWDFLNDLDEARRASLESLNEHGSAIGHNMVIVTLLGAVLLGVRRPLLRWGLALGLIPTVLVLFAAQRRAGIASLVIAGVGIAIVLFWRRRRAFWFVVPTVTLLMVAYLAAFWNAQGSLAFPAQAVRSVVAPGSASAADQSSDLYRLVEAYNLNYTIRTDPVFGLGFGRPFYRPVSLPLLEAFELQAYLPHNSILWVWIKTGFLGFAAMFHLFASSVMLGARRVRDLGKNVDLVVALAGTLYVVMFVVYTYVDVSWDARNAVFLGLACAICSFRDDTGAEDDAPAPEHRGGDVEHARERVATAALAPH